MNYSNKNISRNVVVIVAFYMLMKKAKNQNYNYWYIYTDDDRTGENVLFKIVVIFIPLYKHYLKYLRNDLNKQAKTKNLYDL